MNAPIDHIEDVIVDLTFGRMTRPEAIASIMSVVNVTAGGAAGLIDDPVAPRERYRQALEDFR